MRSTEGVSSEEGILCFLVKIRITKQKMAAVKKTVVASSRCARGFFGYSSEMKQKKWVVAEMGFVTAVKSNG